MKRRNFMKGILGLAAATPIFTVSKAAVDQKTEQTLPREVYSSSLYSGGVEFNPCAGQKIIVSGMGEQDGVYEVNGKVTAVERGDKS